MAERSHMFKWKIVNYDGPNRTLNENVGTIFKYHLGEKFSIREKDTPILNAIRRELASLERRNNQKDEEEEIECFGKKLK